MGKIGAIDSLLADYRIAKSTDKILTKNLRKEILDPILIHCAEAKTIFISLDESLQGIHLNSLPMENGKPVSELFSIRPMVSLFELLQMDSADNK